MSRFANVVLVVLAMARPAFAETMTEDAAVNAAIMKNPRLRAAKWQRSYAEAGVSTASALNNPVLRVQWLRVEDGQPLDSGIGLRLSWTPPQPTEWAARKAVARARVTEADQEILRAAWDLEAETRTAYATAQSLGEALAIANEGVGTRKEIYDVVKSRVQGGVSTRLEANAAALALARAELDRDALAIERSTALAKLATLTGEPAIDVMATSDVDASIPTAHDAEGQAISRSPELRADDARREQARETVRAEKTKRYPWFSLSSIPALRIRDSAISRPVDITFGIDITLPIFDGNGGRIDAAEADARRQADLREADLATLKRDVAVARSETERWQELVLRFETTTRPLLAEHGDLVNEAIAGGRLDVTALLASEEAVLAARRRAVDDRLASRRARIALDRFVGHEAR